MSESVLCRLCVDECSDYKSLYYDSGRGNELHKLTMEYFHPKLVDMKESKHLTVICAECFGHIYEFHSFQTAVSVSQLKLIGTRIKLDEDKATLEKIQDCQSLPVDQVALKAETQLTPLAKEETDDGEIAAISKCRGNDLSAVWCNGPTGSPICTMVHFTPTVGDDRDQTDVKDEVPLSKVDIATLGKIQDYQSLPVDNNLNGQVALKAETELTLLAKEETDDGEITSISKCRGNGLSAGWSNGPTGSPICTMIHVTSTVGHDHDQTDVQDEVALSSYMAKIKESAAKDPTKRTDDLGATEASSICLLDGDIETEAIKKCHKNERYKHGTMVRILRSANVTTIARNKREFTAQPELEIGDVHDVSADSSNGKVVNETGSLSKDPDETNEATAPIAVKDEHDENRDLDVSQTQLTRKNESSTSNGTTKPSDSNTEGILHQADDCVASDHKEAEQRLKCNLCDKHFLSSTVLNWHISRHHVKTRSMPTRNAKSATKETAMSPINFIESNMESRKVETRRTETRKAKRDLVRSKDVIERKHVNTRRTETRRDKPEIVRKQTLLSKNATANSMESKDLENSRTETRRAKPETVTKEAMPSKNVTASSVESKDLETRRTENRRFKPGTVTKEAMTSKTAAASSMESKDLETRRTETRKAKPETVTKEAMPSKNVTASSVESKDLETRRTENRRFKPGTVTKEAMTSKTAAASSMKSKDLETRRTEIRKDKRGTVSSDSDPGDECSQGNEKHSSPKPDFDYDEITKQLKCKLCGNAFPHKASLSRHFRLQHRKQGDTSQAMFKCSMCVNSFSSKSNLRAHVKKQHPDAEPEHDYDEATKRYKCRLCVNTFLTKQHVTLHVVRQHTESGDVKTPATGNEARKMFKCSVCGCSYFYKITLVRHMQSQHPEAHAGRNLSYILDSDYDDTTKSFKCKLCGNSFPRKNILTRHIRWRHGDIPSEIGGSVPAETGSGNNGKGNRIPCNLCGSSYTYISALLLHMKKQHPDPEANYDYDEATQQFKCKFCSNTYTSKSSLKTHMEELHPEPYACNQCGKTFSAYLSLCSHLSYSHIRKPRYKCGTCGKVCKGAILLRKHVRIHRQKGLYACAFCPKVFHQSGRLSRHKRSTHPRGNEHTDETTTAPLGVIPDDGSTPNPRSVCGNTFAEHISFRRRRRNKCAICNKNFKTPCALRIHLAAHMRRVTNRSGNSDDSETRPKST